MAKRNYTNYHKSASEQSEELDVTTEQSEEPDVVVEQDSEIIEKPVKKEVRTLIGVVSNCSKLRVRKFPSIDSDVICVLDKFEEVKIYCEESTDDFYMVYTNGGILGYCMKDYISVKE